MTAPLRNFVARNAGADIDVPLSQDIRQRVGCSECTWRMKCVIGSLPAQRQPPVIARTTFAAQQTLCLEGEPFSSVYLIRSGAIKSLITSEDGRQQIVAIHLPGDTIGVEGIANGSRNRALIAVEKSEICAIGFAGLGPLMSEVPKVQRWYWHALGNELARNAETVRWLRFATAEERVAAFLLDLSRRLAMDETATPEFTLSTSCIDIATHLGLSRETVSRAFAKLRDHGLIDFNFPRVRLRNPLQLGRVTTHHISPHSNARSGRAASSRAPPSCA